MARALAVKLDVDLGGDPSPAPIVRPRGRENARVLQQRLQEAYAAAPAVGGDRELSPFSRLAVILAASGLLWGVIGLTAGAVIRAAL